MNKSFNKLIKSNVILAVLSVFAVVLLVTSVSYSLFITEDKNETNQRINIGNLDAKIVATPFTLNDLYPESESSALEKNNNLFNFTLENDGDYDVSYYAYFTLNSGTLTQEQYQYIKFKLDNGVTKSLADIYSSNRFNLLSGGLGTGETENHQIRFWLDESAVNAVINKQIVLDLVFNGTATKLTRVTYSSEYTDCEDAACALDELYDSF